MIQMDADSRSVSELQERIRSLTSDTSRLQEENQHLNTRTLYLEGRVSHLSASNTHLASQLGRVEEDKLKVSRELVEEKLELNAMREEWEGERFQLRNQVLNQEVVAAQLEEERDRLRKELHLLLSGLQEAQESSVSEEQHKRSSVDAPCRTPRELQLSALEAELLRISTLISTLSHHPVKPEDLAALDQEHRKIEQNLLVSQQEVRSAVEDMRREYEGQRLRLEERAMVMGEEQQKQREAIQRIQQRLSEQSPVMSSEGRLVELDKENSRLQLQVKHLNEEYRARLVCYLHDLADFMDKLRVDGKGGGGAEQGGEGGGEEEQGEKRRRKMFLFVESMLQEVRSSYRSREVQLATATRSYKKKLQRLSRIHQRLLTAYSVQRERILSRPESGLDPGPPEGHFSLEDPELHTAQQPIRAQGNPGQTSEEAKVEEHQKEMTLLEVFEKERAQLITRAVVAEGQVSELQQYIDDHLGRYKQEITRLRQNPPLKDAGPDRTGRTRPGPGENQRPGTSPH